MHVRCRIPIVGLGCLLSFSVPSFAATPVASLTVQPSSIALSGSIPQGAQRIGFLSLRLTASCSADVIVHSITIRHQGLGNASDSARVYLLSNDRRLARGVTFSGRDAARAISFWRATSLPRPIRAASTG